MFGGMIAALPTRFGFGRESRGGGGFLFPWQAFFEQSLSGERILRTELCATQWSSAPFRSEMKYTGFSRARVTSGGSAAGIALGCALCRDLCREDWKVGNPRFASLLFNQLTGRSVVNVRSCRYRMDTYMQMYTR